LSDEVAGWIEVSIVHPLQVQPFALIGGLVVQDRFRGMKIGQRLCQRAEAWAWKHGIEMMRVTSRSTRLDAHRFYVRDGYSVVKTSLVFKKSRPQ
jgi:GNAT superfamily N-acetyltransferase